MRAALYFAPPEVHSLSAAAAAWFGRDAWAGQGAVGGGGAVPDGSARDALVAEPRRYGFHATLKPPFRLAEGRSLAGLRAAVVAFGDVTAPARIERLDLMRIGAFFALVPSCDAPGLQALADSVVRFFEPFRAPLKDGEIARRRPERLSPREREHLIAWGYPYVFDTFRFHMTLTGPVPAAEQASVEAVLRERFAPFIGRPLAVDTLCLFVEPSPPGDFVVDTAVRLAG